MSTGGTTTQDGRAVTRTRRDIVDAIRYLHHRTTRCQWRALPAHGEPLTINMNRYFHGLEEIGS